MNKSKSIMSDRAFSIKGQFLEIRDRESDALGELPRIPCSVITIVVTA